MSTTDQGSSFEKFLYELLFMFPLCLVEGSIVQLYLENRITSWPVGSVPQYVALAGLCIIMAFRHIKSRFRYLIPITISVVILGILWLQNPDTRWEFALNYVWILWMCLVSVLAFVSGLLIAGRKWLKRITMAGLVIGLVASILLRLDLQKYFVGAVLFFVMLVLIEEVQRNWKKRGLTHTDRYLVSVAIFVIVQMAIVYLMPISQERFEWTFVKNIWERLMDDFQYASRFFYSGGEQLGGVIGLSEDSNFLSGLHDENKKICDVTFSRDTGEVVYLRSNIFDHFDGRNWSYKGYDQFYEEDALDLLETWCAIRTYAPLDYADYMWKSQLKMTYGSVHTQFVFAPMKSIMPKNLKEEGQILWQNGAYRTEQMAGYGTNLEYHFYRLNTQHEIFKKFLRQAKGDLPDEVLWEDALRSYRSYLIEPDSASGTRTGQFSYEDFCEYHKAVKEQIDITELSPEVKLYMDELLEGAQTDYEKLERIEQMLKTMTYTVNPGVLPEYVQSPADFLDELLLHKQQGYCSHFATAFVLLARSQGIPARYVQGYYIYRKGATEVEVMSGMAHAWAEAYINGVGWIGFEPTPGKSSGQAWYVADKESVETNEESSDDPYENMENPIALPDVVEVVEEPKKRIEWGKYVGIGGAWIALCLILFLGNRLLEKRKFKRLSNEMRFKVLCNRNGRILKWMDLEIMRGESLEEFGKRVKEVLPEECISYLERMEEVFYGGFPVDQKMCAEVLRCNERLWIELKKVKGKKYIIYLFKPKG